MYLGCLKPFLRCRFGAQSKKYRPKGKAAKIQEAFDVPSYVLHHIMMGQNWPEGDASYHRKISIPSLLVYGMKDPLVSLGLYLFISLLYNASNYINGCVIQKRYFRNVVSLE